MSILGESLQIKRVRERIARIAATDTRVLILGENGTGKELIAQAIHESSKRKDKPFVVCNCAAVPESLLESELFGHEKGAFTGAQERRIGRFEQAEGGTLFLDEIGELPLSTQSKFLRVLQTGTYERVGGRQSLTAHVRVLAATNRNLYAAVKAKAFREDLYHRLAVVPVQSPPLRTRLEDIPLLCAAFIACSERPTAMLTQAGIEALQQHTWPGNVRELQNVVQRMLVLFDEDTLEEAHVMHALSLDHEYESGATESVDPSKQSLDCLVQQIAALTAVVTQQHKTFSIHTTPLSPSPLVSSQEANRFSLGDRVISNKGKVAIVISAKQENLLVALANEYSFPLVPPVHELWKMAEVKKLRPTEREQSSNALHL